MMAAKLIFRKIAIAPLTALYILLLAAPLYVAGTSSTLGQGKPALSAEEKQQLIKQLFEAISANNISLVRSRVNAGADLNAVNEDGLTPAGLAIEKGYFDLAHYLLAARNQQLTNETESKDKNPVQIAPPQQAPLSPEPVVTTTAPPTRNDTLPPPPRLNLPPGQLDPFDPRTKSETLPVVGPVQAPTVKPDLPSRPLRSNIDKLPEKSPAAAGKDAPRVTGPTPIIPLAKKPKSTVTSRPVSKSTAPKTNAAVRDNTTDNGNQNEKGIWDKMVDGVTGVFKSDDAPPAIEPTPSPQPAPPPVTTTPQPQPQPQPQPSKSVQKQTSDKNKKEDEAGEKEGFIGGVWKKITNIF